MCLLQILDVRAISKGGGGENVRGTFSPFTHVNEPFLFPRLSLCDNYIISGRLAQLVEQFVYTEKVGGSNPSSPTSTGNAGFCRLFLYL